MRKIIFHCSGNVTGKEPHSMVCKITGTYKRSVSLLWRLIFYSQAKMNVDELFTKQEVAFFQSIIPTMKDTDYRTPETYFVGKKLK